MNIACTRRYVGIAQTTVVAAAAGLAALGLAGHASADAATVLNTHVGGVCPKYCGPSAALVGVGVTNTQPNVIVTFTRDPNSECPDFTVQVDFGGVTPVTLGKEVALTPGRHSLNFLGASCPNGTMSMWGGTVVVTEVTAPPAAQPKQGPTVTANPGLTGVTFHITDRSGVASQCTYSSEGFESSFGLPANGSHDLFVPAIRLLQNRTGKVTCDNGTSTPTSVFY